MLVLLVALRIAAITAPWLVRLPIKKGIQNAIVEGSVGFQRGLRLQRVRLQVPGIPQGRGIRNRGINKTFFITRHRNLRGQRVIIMGIVRGSWDLVLLM